MEGRQIMAENDVYEVFALRYAERLERTRRESFIFADAHDSPHPIDYFVWVARNQSRTLVIDTGFDQEESRLRDRKILRLPAEALAMVDVDAQSVSDVIITHMHYDHAGTLQDFPAARFHLQADEMAYVTGPSMCQGDLSHPFTADHVCQMVRNVYSGRVSFSDGDAQIAPNITVHKIGGHTRGLQCVRVLTRRGWVVLASDASHFYENVQERKLFPIVLDAEVMLKGFQRLEDLADSPDHIIPGHDPLVRAFYPAQNQSLEDIVYRLDVAPKIPPP
jgi:glyoxylase-like metal-dependent hydrolase (beta-lactamase superfamily II)